jgi:outer membrane protein TolC
MNQSASTSSVRRAALVITSIGLQSCASTGIFDNETHAWRPDSQRLDRIDPVDLVARSGNPPEAPETAMERMLDRELPVEEPEEVRALDLAEVRRSVLRNNLELKAELVSPDVAGANLSAEEAKFEATFFAGYTRNDQSVLTDLEQGEPTNSDEFLAGLRLPLATGGDLSIDTLATRSDLGTSLAGASPDPWESNVRFSIAQPLLRGAGLKTSTASIRIAEWNLDLADARLKLAATRILADADRAYWNLYAAWRELEVRKQQYALAIAQMDRAERRLKAGDAPEVDVIRARSGAGSTLESIIRADANLRIRQRDVKRIMNDTLIPIGGETALRPATDPNPLRIDLDGDALAAEAVANRMEMLELEVQLAIDSMNIDLRRNEALPVFGLDYRYSIQGDDGGFGSAYSSLGDFDSHRIGISGEMPIGNQVRENRLAAAVLERVRRLATRESRVMAIRGEVFDALDRLRQAWQSILASRLETILAARVVAGEERQFEVGLRTSTEVLDAQSRLADAQSREVRALADYQIALVDIAFASGTLFGQAKVDFVVEEGRSSIDFESDDPAAGVPGANSPE